MPKLKIELNKTIEGSLKWATGKHFDSKIPGKAGSYMYSLTSGEVIFIDEDDCEDPDLMFREKGIVAGTPFSLTLRKTAAGGRYYELKNLTEAVEPEAPVEMDAESLRLQALLNASLNRERAKRALSAPATPGVSGQSKNTTANSTPDTGTIAHTAYSRVMAGALIAAIDASREAKRYAESVGFEIEFTTEDIRCLSSTLFIQASKDPAFLSQPVQKVNGASWQQ